MLAFARIIAMVGLANLDKLTAAQVENNATISPCGRTVLKLTKATVFLPFAT